MKMGVSDFLKRIRGNSAIEPYYDIQTRQLEILSKNANANAKKGKKQASPEAFMLAIRTVSESEDTIKVFDAFADRPISEKTDPVYRIVPEFFMFLECAMVNMPAESSLDLAKYMVSNKIIRKSAQIYPDRMMFMLYSISINDYCHGQTGIELLSILEKDNIFFPNITRQAKGSTIAAFFINIRTGLSDDFAVLRFKTSPSFQAALGNRDFLDYLNINDPVLLQVIRGN